MVVVPSSDPQRTDTPAPAYTAPDLARRSVWVWVLAGAWLLLAGWTTHLILSTVASHDAMSASAALEAEDAASREAFLERIPEHARRELRDTELYRTVPFEDALNRPAVRDWGRATPALADSLELLDDEEDAHPTLPATPAAQVAANLGLVLDDVTSEVTAHARALQSAELRLVAAAVLSILAAGAGVVLVLRGRRNHALLLVSSHALRESEERYRNMFEKNSTIQLVVHPGTRRIVDANRAACDFYGAERSVLTSKRLSDFVVRPKSDVEEEPREDGRPMPARHRLMSGDVRDVVSSGYANDEVLANYRKHGFCGVLPKPYTRDELAALLTELMGNGTH